MWRRHCGGGAVFSSPHLHASLRQLYVASLGGRLLCLKPVSSVPKADRAPRLNSLCLNLSVALRHRTAARSCGRSAETSRSSRHQTPPLASWSSAPWMETSAASAARENWWVEIQADWLITASCRDARHVWLCLYAMRDFKAEMRRSCSWRNLFTTNSNLIFLSV